MWNKNVWHALIIKWLLLHILGAEASGIQEKDNPVPTHHLHHPNKTKGMVMQK
jgi:hypothetical protein